MPLFQSRYLPLLALVLLLAASAGLYVPWIDNPLVFDDPNLLRSPALGDYAVMPFSLQPRQFPYFTLGFEQVISNGNLHVSRYVALILHGLNGFLLFLLARRLLGRATTNANKATFLAFAAGLLFVVHPVSVYAAGYLIQRTILFSTFFLLLSAIQFDKALTEGSLRQAILAGLCYGMAVMSKEHALTGFAAVAGLAVLHKVLPWKEIRPILFTYLAVCLPITLWVVSIKLGFVGAAYEPDASNILNSVEFPNTNSRLGNWALSAAWQCNFFFDYLGFWLWPTPSALSIDIRPDLNAVSELPLLIIPPLAFLGLMATATYLITSQKTGHAIRTASEGLLWLTILFLVELSTIRIQEPIVLYRSYLWAPGLFIVLTILIQYIFTRSVFFILLIPLFSLSLVISWNRLETFSSPIKLWNDAAAKLPQPAPPSAARIYNNRGLLRLSQKDFNGAMEDFSIVTNLAPKSPMGYIGQSHVDIATNNFSRAEENLKTALFLKPDSGYAWLRLGFLMEYLDRHKEADFDFEKATALGYPPIQFGKVQKTVIAKPQKNKAP